MAMRELKRWQRALLYSAFTGFAALLAFYLTFPYDALKSRLRQTASSAGITVDIDSLGPGLLGLRAKGVHLAKRAAVEGEPPPPTLNLDSVSVRPTFFPPGLSLSVSALGGSVDVFAGGFFLVRLATGLAAKSPEGSIGLKISVDDLDVSKGNLKAFSGLDLVGIVNADVALTVPMMNMGPRFEPDLGQATGTVALHTKGLTLNGGTVNIALPMYGPEPTPIDLPKIVLGDVDGALKFDKGAGTVDELKSKSADLEAQGTGSLKLAKSLAYSEPNLELRFKADPEFQKRLGLLGSALSIVGPDPKDSSWRMGRLTGYLGKPSFR